MTPKKDPKKWPKITTFFDFFGTQNHKDPISTKKIIIKVIKIILKDYKKQLKLRNPQNWARTGIYLGTPKMAKNAKTS